MCECLLVGSCTIAHSLSSIKFVHGDCCRSTFVRMDVLMPLRRYLSLLSVRLWNKWRWMALQWTRWLYADKSHANHPRDQSSMLRLRFHTIPVASIAPRHQTLSCSGMGVETDETAHLNAEEDSSTAALKRALERRAGDGHLSFADMLQQLMSSQDVKDESVGDKHPSHDDFKTLSLKEELKHASSDLRGAWIRFESAEVSMLLSFWFHRVFTCILCLCQWKCVRNRRRIFSICIIAIA